MREHERNRKAAMDTERKAAEKKTQETEAARPEGRYSEMQSAMRFPVKLPVSVHAGSSDCTAQTSNISANGVLFQVDVDMPVGSPVEFTISMPADVVGADTDVQVRCRGRVVRCMVEGDQRSVGAVIDEYSFERA